MSDATPEVLGRDERRLAELGYKQSLNRAWSGFSNFAISFTIISVLAGCFTTYGQAWNNGGPIAITWGWPIISAFILIVALSMSELVSKYPTAGAIYWWSSEMGGRVWGWFTGWFNMIGLIGVVASVDYACATFLNAVLGLYKVDFIFNFGDDAHILRETFFLFAVILVLHALINIFQTQLLALFNNVSVWVHVIGVAVIVAILAFVPDTHQSFDFVFTKRINNSGFSGGMFWFYILPLGFLLTQYTITGFDASAHISEETKDAEQAAARGVWRSVFYSAVIGWIVLLAITFAATDVKAINEGAGSSLAIFDSALTPAAAKAVVLISTIGQFFCGMACLTSASRMFYAFSRDRAVPGNRLWTRLTQKRVPSYAVMMVALLSLLITLPALHGDENAFPFAFFAVVSITVIGLYIAYVIPIFLRWRMGDKFQPASWTLGRKYKWMNAVAVGEVAIITVVFCLPFTPAAVPWNDGFKWEAFNYAPLTVGLVLIGAWLGWILWAKKHWPGHVREVDPFGEGAEIRPDVPTTPPEPEPGSAPA
ncbi:MAG TPA: amino acid permease [Thermoleophilaceae bacterium]